MGDVEKLFTLLNSALKVLLGLDIFPRVAKKKVKFCCPVKYVNIRIFSQLTWLSQTNYACWRKTTYTFEFSVKRSIRIRYFSSCAKKKLNFVDQCYQFIPLLSAAYKFLRNSVTTYAHKVIGNSQFEFLCIDHDGSHIVYWSNCGGRIVRA